MGTCIKIVHQTLPHLRFLLQLTYIIREHCVYKNKLNEKEGNPKMKYEKPTVCVLDASTYVGFWILKGLLDRGFTVHAATQKNGKHLHH